MVWGNWGGLASPLRTHQRMKWLARVGTKHGHAPSRDPIGKQNRVGVSQHPGRRGGTSVKAPKSRITASSSQGFAHQLGERQPPPANKVISKIKQNTPSPSPARGAEEPQGEVPACHVPTLPSLRQGSNFGDPEDTAIEGGLSPIAPEKGPGEGEKPTGHEQRRPEPSACPPPPIPCRIFAAAIADIRRILPDKKENSGCSEFPFSPAPSLISAEPAERLIDGLSRRLVRKEHPIAAASPDRHQLPATQKLIPLQLPE